MKVKEKNLRKGVSIATVICTLIKVGFLGSYAYFIGSTTGTNEDVSVQTGSMELIFSDGSSNFQGSLEFGSNATKTFTIENTGSLDAVVNIYFKNLINTYLEESLTYSLSYSDEENGNYTEIVTNKNVPRSSIKKDELLAESINIPSKIKYYYKLVITLNYLESTDQTPDLKAMLSTEFSITEERKNAIVTFNPTGGTVEVNSKEVAINAIYGNLPTPIYEGYNFVGWFTKENDGEKITNDSKVSTNEDHILYAHWEKIEESTLTLTKLNLKSKTGTPNFATPATTNETANGLYSMEDDYGTSYYFRGSAENNYAKFAGFYWRIVRINGDGSLRVIYDGPYVRANGRNGGTAAFALMDTAWNIDYSDDAKYVGYMYGGANGTASTSKIQAQTNTTSSNIKNQLETWYKTNIADKGYDSYVSDEIFCNDRSTPGKLVSGWNEDTGLGYGSNQTTFGAYARMGIGPNSSNYQIPQPQFTCPNKNDAFTKSDTEKGNGKLSQKVGLITKDETIAAGSGKYKTGNVNYYLFKDEGYKYWTFTPISTTAMFVVNSSVISDVESVNNSAPKVAPVINLSSEYAKTLIGNGTISNPFRANGVTP